MKFKDFNTGRCFVCDELLGPQKDWKYVETDGVQRKMHDSDADLCKHTFEIRMLQVAGRIATMELQNELERQPLTLQLVA
jgi:hypothetical protein